jgi:hypothetical protein
MRVVAESVETQEQMQILQALSDANNEAYKKWNCDGRTPPDGGVCEANASG